MGSLAEIILSFLSLVEAEGKALRVGIVKAGLALAFAGLVLVLFATGMGLIVWAIYLYLRAGHLNMPTAALLDGFITLFLAGIVAWLVRITAR